MKIINVENDSSITTLDKNNPNYVDFGIFQLGEGKLFQLSPVFVNGGTLVGNETKYSEIFSTNINKILFYTFKT